MVGRFGKKTYRCPECGHRFFDRPRQVVRSGNVVNPGAERRHRRTGSTVDLVLELLLTRLMVWTVAALADGAAIIIGSRISFLLGVASAIATLLLVVALVALYETVVIGRRGISVQFGELTRRKVKAAAIAMFVAAVIAGALLVMILVLVSVFEPRDSSSPSPRPS